MPITELEALCYARYEAARGEEASVEHQRELVKRLLQKLPESERTVVTLYYLAEMTSEEVSAFLGVSPNTIRSRLRRARKRLKEQEHLLHSISGMFQLPPTLTENIMREIAKHQTGISFREQAVATVGTLIRVNLFGYPDGRDGTSGVIAFPATL